MKYKVVYTDSPFDDINIEKEILDEIDAEVVDARKHKLDPIEVAKDADGLIVTYHKIDVEFINSLSDECKIISRTGIGVDNVDVGVPKPRKRKHFFSSNHNFNQLCQKTLKVTQR